MDEGKNQNQAPEYKSEGMSQEARKILAVAIIAAAIMIAVGTIYFFFFYEYIPPRETLVNEEFSYQVDYFEGWDVEEENYPEREAYSVWAISLFAEECGFDCAVASRTKVSKGDVSFIIHVFGNSEPLATLEEFVGELAGTYGMMPELEDVVVGNDIEALKQVVSYDDGRETTNYYFSHKGSMYWVNKNIPDINDSDYIEESKNIDFMIESLVLGN